MVKSHTVVTAFATVTSWKDKEQLYLKTQLIGPSAGEEIIETQTCPLVVRCERTERCRIESWKMNWPETES